jgi:hypothetical protein
MEDTGARRGCRRSETSSVTATIAQLDGRDAILLDIPPGWVRALPGGPRPAHPAGRPSGGLRSPVGGLRAPAAPAVARRWRSRPAGRGRPRGRLPAGTFCQLAEGRCAPHVPASRPSPRPSPAGSRRGGGADQSACCLALAAASRTSRSKRMSARLRSTWSRDLWPWTQRLRLPGLAPRGWPVALWRRTNGGSGLSNVTSQPYTLRCT